MSYNHIYRYPKCHISSDNVIPNHLAGRNVALKLVCQSYGSMIAPICPWTPASFINSILYASFRLEGNLLDGIK